MKSLNQPVLLSDEQIKTFIRDGVLLLKADFPEAFHERLLTRLNEVYEEEGNPGNNLLPRIREVQKVFDHPVITGALTSVLGPDYFLHTHRHGHFNASPQSGPWHKDNYWGYYRTRNHHPWWAMIMYFPQDTPLELGPTGVMPGTQFHETRTFADEDPASEVRAIGKAGTFALIHYDIWHRSTDNILGKPRYMLKFEFMRTRAPDAPSWKRQTSAWAAPEQGNMPTHDHALIWEENWYWLSGKVGSLAGTRSLDAAAIRELARQLEGGEEPDALNAAYSLGAGAQKGIAVLLAALRHRDAGVSRNAAYGLSIAGSAAVSGLIEALFDENEEVVCHAAFALGELRELAERAVPGLAATACHPTAKVRHAAVEALGLIGQRSRETLDILIRCLRDDNNQVRFTAALSLLRLGPAAGEAVPALAEALDDADRYVRGHAAEALRYVDTDEARGILFKELFNLRWCSDTTKTSAL